MQVEIPDDLIKRATKAANWVFGKDTPQTQVIDILTDFCETTELKRQIEEINLKAIQKRILKNKEAKKVQDGTNQGT